MNISDFTIKDISECRRQHGIQQEKIRTSLSQSKEELSQFGVKTEVNFNQTLNESEKIKENKS